MTFSKILVGTDFSTQAEVAVEQAAVLAARHRAELILVHAVNLSMHHDGHPYFSSPPASYFAQVKKLQAELRAKLAKEIERLGERGADTSMVFVDEAPETAIVRVASEHDVDLVVVGSHGLSGLDRLLVGSVSEAVARNAECDVLVAREPGAAPYRRILVPTDFSECSERAVRRAVELVDADGTIEVYHCWQLPGGPINYWGTMGQELRDSIRKGAEDFGARCLRAHAGGSATMHFTHVDDDARRGIQKRLAQGDIDLVVMGTHGRKGLQRLLLGSIAQSTLRHATTSVYLTR